MVCLFIRGTQNYQRDTRFSFFAGRDTYIHHDSLAFCIRFVHQNATSRFYYFWRNVAWYGDLLRKDPRFSMNPHNLFVFFKNRRFALAEKDISKYAVENPQPYLKIFKINLSRSIGLRTDSACARLYW